MMKKNESREDRSVEKAILANGFGRVIKRMMDKKGLTVAKLCTDLGTSEYKLAVDVSTMSRILSGKHHFRADYLIPILVVGEFDYSDFMSACEDLTDESMKSGRLYYKRPYHPRKDKEEDDN